MLTGSGNIALSHRAVPSFTQPAWQSACSVSRDTTHSLASSSSQVHWLSRPVTTQRVLAVLATHPQQKAASGNRPHRSGTPSRGNSGKSQEDLVAAVETYRSRLQDGDAQAAAGLDELLDSKSVTCTHPELALTALSAAIFSPPGHWCSIRCHRGSLCSICLHTACCQNHSLPLSILSSHMQLRGGLHHLCLPGAVSQTPSCTHLRCCHSPPGCSLSAAEAVLPAAANAPQSISLTSCCHMACTPCSAVLCTAGMFRAAWTVYELDPKKRSRLRYNTFQKMCLAAIQVGTPAVVAARKCCASRPRDPGRPLLGEHAKL